MPISNPTQLADEFKKSGEFDRLRRELLANFRSSENFTSFMDRVEDVARQRLASDNKVKALPETSMVKELMQHLNRYPIIERAVSDMEEGTLSDSAYKANLRSRISKVLQEDRVGKQTTQSFNAGTSALRIETSIATVNGLSPDTQKVDKPQVPMAVESHKAEQPRETIDGNESEDSAMLESPTSDREDKPLFA